MLNDYMTSLIRTWIPVGVGAAITWLAVHFGVVLDEGTSAAVMTAAVGVVIAVWYAAARLIEEAYPGVGKLLVALGLGNRPKYDGQQRAVRM